MDLKDLKKEVEIIEKDALKRTEQLGEVSKRASLKKLGQQMGNDCVDYIG